MMTLTSFKARARRRGLTLLEVVVVILILVGLAVVLLPSLARGGHSKPLVCCVNVKGIGTSMKIYANDNGGHWAIPAFNKSAIGQIDYLAPVGGGYGTSWSPDRAMESTSGPDGAVSLSPTRAFWMLVRSGDTTSKQYVCPSSGDTPDPTEDVEAYYDFADRSHVSYGFQVPFAAPESRAFEGIDNRVALVAEKGPYVSARARVAPAQLDQKSPRSAWAPYNSPNHGGEGQNVLYADGHVDFETKPIVGVDHDNIYTIATSDTPSGRMIGESPWLHRGVPRLSYLEGRVVPVCEDSLIYP